MISLTVRPGEKGTMLVEVTCHDEDANTVAPTELKWTLTDTGGTVVNSRSEVSATPGDPTEILLTGADLQILSTNDTGNRVLTAKAKYNSTRGVGLPCNEEIHFNVENLLNVS